MEKEVLVILMVAFGIFAIAMFILFFIYLKKYYNERHLEEDYQKELDEKIEEERAEGIEIPVSDNFIIPPLEPKVSEPVIVPPVEEKNVEEDMEFVPIKKK